MRKWEIVDQLSDDGIDGVLAQMRAKPEKGVLHFGALEIGRAGKVVGGPKLSFPYDRGISDLILHKTTASEIALEELLLGFVRMISVVRDRPAVDGGYLP